MKKIIFRFSPLLFCLLLLSGCAPSAGSSSAAEDPVGKRDSLPFSEGQLYAAAYLGYQQITDLDYYVEQSLDEEALPTHYLSPGEYYLVIPRYSGMSLSLYQNDLETSAPILRFEDPDCRPFLLQCNASDIFADATIRLSYEGRDTEFSPFLSLKDGAVEIGPDGLDITKT